MVRSVLVLLSLLCAACGGSNSAPERPARPAILLISVDTLRADHLGCYGYDPYPEPVSPAIDALAAEGTVFRQCFAPRGQTVPSLCSMMTGTYPSRHGVRENTQTFRGNHLTWAEYLNPLGYETVAFIAYLPMHHEGNPARGAARFEPGTVDVSISKTDQWRWDEGVKNKTVEYLQGLAAGRSRPFFLWAHFYDVHRPYAPPAPYDRMFTGDYDGPLLVPAGAPAEAFQAVDDHLCESTVRGRALEPADHQYVLGLYDGGVRSTDRHVADILAALESSGWKERTLVIFTADHGEELGDHQNYYFHGNSMYDSTLRIPLILRWPGEVAAGRVDERLVQNLDLLPTVLEWLGEPAPPEMEGVSLAPWLGADPPPGVPRELAYIEWQELIVGVRSSAHKFIHNPDGVHPKKPPYYGLDHPGFVLRCEELYDLRRDPGEQQDRAREGGAALRELRQAALRHRGRPGQVEGWRSLEDSELIEQLRAVGYVGSPPDRGDVILGAEDCEED